MSNTVEEDNIDDNFLNNNFPNINKFLDIDSPLISDISGIEHFLDNIKNKLNTNQSQQEQITTCDDKNENILNEINKILNNTGGETTNKQEDLGIEKDIITKIKTLKEGLDNIKDENEIALNELKQSRNEIIQHVDKILNEQIDKYYSAVIIGDNTYTYQKIQEEIKSFFKNDTYNNYEYIFIENIENIKNPSSQDFDVTNIINKVDYTKSNDEINKIFEQKANILKELYNKKNDELNKKNDELNEKNDELNKNNEKLKVESTQMKADNTTLTTNNEELTKQNKNLKEFESRLQEIQVQQNQQKLKEQQQEKERQKEEEEKNLQEKYGGVITLKNNVEFTSAVEHINYLSIEGKNIGIVIPFNVNSNTSIESSNMIDAVRKTKANVDINEITDALENAQVRKQNEIDVDYIFNKINSQGESKNKDLIQVNYDLNKNIPVTNFEQGNYDRFHLALLLFKKVKNNDNEKTYRLHYISSSNSNKKEDYINYKIFKNIIQENNDINETLKNYNNNNDDRVVLVPLLTNNIDVLKRTLTDDIDNIKTTKSITIVNKKTGPRGGTKGGGNNSSNVNIMALKNKTIRSNRGGYRYSDLGMKGLSILLTEEETNKSKSNKLIKGSKTKKNIKMMKGRKGNIGNKVNNKKSQYKKQSMKKKLKRTMKK